MNPFARVAQGLLNTARRATRRSAPTSEEKAWWGLSSVTSGSGGWTSIIHEPFTGAWQRNLEVRVDSVLTYSTVFACISLISADISKLRIRLVAQDANGIWTEVDSNSPFWPVLRKPNRYQTRIQFWANWIQSKLIHGNTYVLKERDNRGGDSREVGVVRRLYILDPTRVDVLCAPDGSVFYRLRSDNLSGLQSEMVTVPASEIIHDHWNEFYHPLVGTSPITAAGLAAMQGLRIQENSARFFASGANPGGILSAPGHINDDTARRLKEYWDANYSAGGPNVGRVAVLGDDLKYQPLMMSATDSQLLEQLKWTAETVCSAFHVPAHMVGIGQPPSYNNIEALNQAYYSQCLQVLLEAAEVLLDEGLDLPKPLGTEFDLDGLLRMDTATKVKAAADAIGSGGMAPNEARMRYFDLGPVKGGESPYLQQQQFSLAALAERDQDKPFSKPEAPTPAPAAESSNDGSSAGDTDGDSGDAARAFYADEILRRSQPHYVSGAS